MTKLSVEDGVHISRYRSDRFIDDKTRRGPPSGQDPSRRIGEFYVDVLGGREVDPPVGEDAPGCRWFLIGETLVEVPTTSSPLDRPVELEVHALEELLELAWDAGYTVEVREHESGATMSILDPCGRRIELRAAAR